MNEQYKAGFSQADITPDFPVELIGCYREDSRACGVHEPLYVQVLLFEQGERRHCLIAIDSLGLTTARSDRLREKAAQMLGIGPENIMLNFSHTHSAPAPLSPLNGETYLALLSERVLSCVKEARANLRPCLISWTLGEAGIGENRRDGCDILDNRLGALQIVDAGAEQPMALLLRVCAHANVLMSHSNKLSSDYIGLARKMIAADQGYPVMIVQGASGNLKPRGVHKIDGGNERVI